MEGVVRVAKAYHARASADEKKLVKQYFKKLDKNRDGKISKDEFLESASEWLSSETVFYQLDADGDGSLSFEEAVVLYYIDKKIELPFCKGCHRLIIYPYFSCMSCLKKHPNTFDLCSDCFGDRNYTHEHLPTEFMDQFSLVDTFGSRTAKGGMDKLREIAKAHYESGSAKVQNLALDFFRCMDTDGDDHVNLQEFLEFMREEGYERMCNPRFFKDLDKYGNGNLDFWGVMTVYYILKSGRPFCDSCANFIPGIYFSCVECFKDPQRSYNICFDCYQSNKSRHNHNGRKQFLDNYTLLEATRNPALARVTGTSTSNNQVAIFVGKKDKKRKRETAIVSANKTDSWKVALKTFEVALAIGSISTTLCTIL